MYARDNAHRTRNIVLTVIVVVVLLGSCLCVASGGSWALWFFNRPAINSWLQANNGGKSSSSVPTPEIVPTEPPTADAGGALGTLWTPEAFIPMANGIALDWNEQMLIPGWVLLPGLVEGTQVLYLQSGVPNEYSLKDFVVPQNEELVFGAVSAKIVIEDVDGKANTFAYDNGFYAAIPSGTKVLDLSISNGFAVLALLPNAQDEFCARVAQTYVEGWANAHVFADTAWADPVCVGKYAVPIDSDREHGGILPFLPTATPTATATP